MDTSDELERVIRHVAEADFGQEENSEIPGEYNGKKVEGQEVDGQLLRPGQFTKTGYTHYIHHVRHDKRWNPGADTSYQQYLEDIKEVITNPETGIAIFNHEDGQQITFIGKAGWCRGKANILIAHRISFDHWMTAYVKETSIDKIKKSLEGAIWLQEP